MTATTPVVWHFGPRSGALAERLTAGPSAAATLEPARSARATAFANGRPILAIAAARSVALGLTSTPTDRRHEVRVSVVDEAARVDWPASSTATLGTWPPDATATDKTARSAGPKP